MVEGAGGGCDNGEDAGGGGGDIGEEACGCGDPGEDAGDCSDTGEDAGRGGDIYEILSVLMIKHWSQLRLFCNTFLMQLSLQKEHLKFNFFFLICYAPKWAKRYLI